MDFEKRANKSRSSFARNSAFRRNTKASKAPSPGSLLTVNQTVYYVNHEPLISYRFGWGPNPLAPNLGLLGAGKFRLHRRLARVSGRPMKRRRRSIALDLSPLNSSRFG